jgi:hypothetical protein
MPSLSIAIRNAVISLSNLSGLIAILPPSVSSIILQCPNIALCSVLKLTGTIFMSLVASRNFSDLYRQLHYHNLRPHLFAALAI